MPKTKISEFSATPANNTDIDSINIAEGCAPSGINDAIRELMSQLKDFQTGAAGDSFGGPITGAVNGTVGATTPNTGAFTTLSATGVTTVQAGTAALPAITTTGDTNTGIFFPAADTIAFSEGGAEAARIDSSGNLLVGTTSQITNEKLSVNTGNTVGVGVKTTGGASNAPILSWNATTTGDGFFVAFATETSLTVRGSITYNRAAGLTSYNTTSDYRAKDITGPVTGSGALIDSVPVYMGKMKGATQERPMFIAHEVPAYAHTGVKDAVDKNGNPKYQQMDASALIPVMWAEIQSLRQRLAAANL